MEKEADGNNEIPDILQEAEKIVAASSENSELHSEKDGNQGEEDNTSSGSPEPEGATQDLMNSLMRERADFVNYKARMVKEIATAQTSGIKNAVRQLLPILDEVGRAKDAGDLDDGSPFYSIATKLEDVLTKLKVTKYGAKGDVFDPKLHEALMNHKPQEGEDLHSGEVLIDQVLESGYKYDGEVMRVAKVATISE
ncbi:MAG: nucleotide exchange factor GrpE [Candidatus Ancillula sp.]|jgi:molecular chaperone GrpE|nr:nucleotide exchange factor GrpE [Candidatus Ancillula sp.]